MTAIADSAVTKRWTRRLRIREHLLADAQHDLAHAGAADRAHAQKRVALRKQQVADARKVLDRHEKPKLSARERAVRSAMIGVKHRDEIIYTQGPDRWDGIRRHCRAFKNSYPKAADCSSFVTWCFWDALGGEKSGADIINGSHWAAGYTGTQCSNGHSVPYNKIRPGDLV